MVYTSYNDLYFLSVTLSFNLSTYTITEGEGVDVNLTLVRSGYLTGATVVSVTTAGGTATGIIIQTLISVLF